LTEPFVAGFIVQRLLEIVDPISTAKLKDPNQKKIVLGLLSLVIGCTLAGFMGIRIFHALNDNFSNVPVDILLSGIFISAGTEGFNSLLKFANYKKETSKADAAEKISQLKSEQLALVNPA